MPWRRCPYCVERGEYAQRLVADQVMCVACTEQRVRAVSKKPRGKRKAVSMEIRDDLRAEARAELKRKDVTDAG